MKITKKQFKKMSKSAAFNKVVAPMYEKLDESNKLLKVAKAELNEVKYEFEDISLAFGLLQATFTDLEKEAEKQRKEAEKQRKEAEKQRKEAEKQRIRAEKAEAKAEQGLQLNKEVQQELDKLCEQFEEASIEYDEIKEDMDNIIEKKVTVAKYARDVLTTNLFSDRNKDELYNIMCNEVKNKERVINKSIHQLEGINSRKNNLDMKIGRLVRENRG